MRPRFLAEVLFGVVLFGGILIGGFKPLYLRALFGDARGEVNDPDRHAPGYPAFLEEVARRTRPGQSIAIVAPTRLWHYGYSYAYYRATYFLVGRRAVPIVDPDDSFHPERLKETDLIAAWNTPDFHGHEVLWRGHGGVLLRGTR